MPPGRGKWPRGVCGMIDRFRRPVGRAISPAEPIIFKNNNVRRGQDPALQCGANTMQPANGQHRGVSAGGMYAVPTHGPNAVTAQKTVHKAPGRGPHACGPYNARQTSYRPYPGGRFAAGVNARPTRRGKRHTTHTRATAAFYRTANLIFSSGRRPRSTTIFHFPSLFLRCFFNNTPHSNSRRFAGRRGGRITAIPGEVGFAGGAAVSAPPRHFPCPHKAAAAVRVYVLLAGRTPARLNPSGAASVAAPGGLLIQQSRRWQKPGSPPGRRRPGPAPRR